MTSTATRVDTTAWFISAHSLKTQYSAVGNFNTWQHCSIVPVHIKNSLHLIKSTTQTSLPHTISTLYNSEDKYGHYCTLRANGALQKPIRTDETRLGATKKLPQYSLGFGSPPIDRPWRLAPPTPPPADPVELEYLNFGSRAS